MMLALLLTLLYQEVRFADAELIIKNTISFSEQKRKIRQRSRPISNDSHKSLLKSEHLKLKYFQYFFTNSSPTHLDQRKVKSSTKLAGFEAFLPLISRIPYKLHTWLHIYCIKPTSHKHLCCLLVLLLTKILGNKSMMKIIPMQLYFFT